MIKKDILVETRRLLAEATSEPWSQSALAGAYVVGSKENNFPVICSLGEYEKDGTLELEFENSVNNMALITRAPELLRNLADEVETLRERLVAYQMNESSLERRT